MDAVSTRPRPPARRGTTQRASVPLNADRTATTPASSSTSALTALPSTPRTLQRRSRGGRVSLDYGSGHRTAASADQGAGHDLEPGTTSAQLAQHNVAEPVGGPDKVDHPSPLGQPEVTPLRHDRDVAHRRRSLNRPDEDGVGVSIALEEPLTRRHLEHERGASMAAATGNTAEPEDVHDIAPATTATSPALAHATREPPTGGIPCDDRKTPPDGFATAYERLSRADLERLLGEADRIIREKEQELTIFTTAGQGLLDEYNALKQRHDSLRRKLPADLQSPAGSPVKQRQLGSGGVPLRSENSPPRMRKESLRFGDGPEGASTRAREQSRSQHQTDLWLTPTSTVRHNLRTPSGSPTSSRDVIKSGSISTSSKSGSAPSSRFLFSPSAAQADQAAALTQANYALTLQLNEVQADSEAAVREGRKRLRRLERELQSVRADLERVEQRNAILESHAEDVKEKENELAKSARAIRVAPRKILEPVTPDRCSYDQSPARTATAPLGHQESPTRTRSSHVLPRHEPESWFGPIGPIEASKDPALLHAFPTFSAPQAHPALPVVPARSVYRTVSTSSLMPLPPPVRIDPSLEQQQDELVDQLIAKIDELQDTNYGFLSERETMFSRLAQVQEEMYDWKERCEELEDENQQHRLIGWRDAVQDADGRSALEQEGALLVSSQASPPPPNRPHMRRVVRHRLAADSNSVSLPSSLDLSDAVRSLSTMGEMSPSLGDELDKGGPATPPHALRDPCDPKCGLEFEGSVVLCGGDDPTDLALELELHLGGCRHALVKGDEPAVTTSDDLLCSGGLRWAGQPDADKYEALEDATAELAPDWQDQPRLSRAARLSRLRIAKERLEVLAGTNERLVGSMTHASRASRCDPYGPDLSSQSLLGKEQHKPRRRRALRRLSFEAQRRQTAGVLVRATRADSDAESTTSSAWSELDGVEQSLVHRSDYYPTARTARYRPTILASMMSDSAAQHVVTFLTWIRFMAILTTAIIFAVWQGPRKTLSLVDGHRRRLK